MLRIKTQRVRVLGRVLMNCLDSPGEDVSAEIEGDVMAITKKNINNIKKKNKNTKKKTMA